MSITGGSDATEEIASLVKELGGKCELCLKVASALDSTNDFKKIKEICGTSSSSVSLDHIICGILAREFAVAVKAETPEFGNWESKTTVKKLLVFYFELLPKGLFNLS